MCTYTAGSYEKYVKDKSFLPKSHFWCEQVNFLRFEVYGTMFKDIYLADFTLRLSRIGCSHKIKSFLKKRSAHSLKANYISTLICLIRTMTRRLKLL